MVLNSKIFEENGKRFSNLHPRAKKILSKANGNKNYKKIAEEVDVHEKTVSPILKQAEDLGFAKKVKPGVYKKISSRMKYIPKRKKRTTSKKGIISKTSKKSKKVNNKPKNTDLRVFEKFNGSFLSLKKK